MFRHNFGLKPVFGFKPRFQTLVLTKDKVTHWLGCGGCHVNGRGCAINGTAVTAVLIDQ